MNTAKTFQSATLATAISLAICTPTYAVDIQLAPTVVTATRQASRGDQLLSDVTVIERDAIEQSGGESIVDLLAKQPGFQITQNGGPGTTAQLFIRGARTEQVKILVDGMPINSIDTSGSPLRFLPLSNVDRIEILRGPASALYGADAVGGVIQIFTRKGRAGIHVDAFAGFGTNGTQKVESGLSGGNERWRFSLSGSDFRTDGISAVRNARRRDSDNDPMRTLGVNGSLSFIPTAGHELSAQWSHNHGQTFFDSTSGTGTFNSRNDFINESWSLASKNAINEAWDSTLRYGQSLDDQTSYSSATGSTIITRTSQVSWQNDVKLPLGKGLVLFERLDQHVGPTNKFTGGKTDIHNDAVVLGWTANFEKHRWQLSGRHDNHSSFGDRNTWAAGYGYALTSAWRINASAGTSFKAPTPYQLYATSSGLIPNPNLRPEEGRNKELSLIWAEAGNTASVTWYRNDVTDLIDYQSGAQQYRNVNKAKFEGWTFTAGSTVSEWNISAAVDLLEARDETTHQTLERRAKEKLSLNADRNWGALTTGIELQAAGHRYSGLQRTSTFYDREALRMGGYTTFNVTAKYVLTPELTLELRGNNLANKQYTTIRANALYDYNAPGANYFVGLRYSMK